MKRTLIRGAIVVTMDRQGVLPQADLPVEGDRIAAIAPTLAAAEVVNATGCIVIPGLVNAHMHTWQTALRGVAANWTLPEYFKKMHAGLATVFEPEDLHIATLVGGPPNLKSSAIVQVRVYVQDARTGETLWSNRAEVETAPFSIFHFDDQHLKSLFDEATEKAVAEVMQTFFHGRDRWGEMRNG